MKTEIILPTFRAKHIVNDNYIEGSLLGGDTIVDYSGYSENDKENSIRSSKIDKSTLSIHFDKKDKYGKKVFFSLNPDGRGGDLLKYGLTNCKYIASWSSIQDRLQFNPLDDDFVPLNLMAVVEVVGIQK